MTEVTTIAGILNDLVTINKDHIVGHKEAIHDMDRHEERTVQLLKAMVEQSENFIDELRAEIHKLGAEVTDKTITAGWVYNTWMDIVYSDGGEKPDISKFCDQIEDTTLEAYDSALLKLKDLDKNIFDMVLRQKQQLAASSKNIRSALHHES